MSNYIKAPDRGAMLNADDFVVGKDEIGRNTVEINPDRDMFVIVELGDTIDGNRFKSNYNYEEIKRFIEQGKNLFLRDGMGMLLPCNGAMSYEMHEAVCFTRVQVTDNFPYSKCVINYWIGTIGGTKDYPFIKETIKIEVAPT